MAKDIKALGRWHDIKRRIGYLLPLFALLVFVAVFWWLKLTALTMAGDAFCGYEEHIHTLECGLGATECTIEHQHTPDCVGAEFLCGLEAHTHTSDCYSDIKADLETPEVWAATLPDTESMTTGQRITAIASSQLGYTESRLNYILDAEGERRGYTRYGEWFGNPYGAWSNMFTAFCLKHAGIEDMPMSAGADTMLTEWRDEGRYRDTDEYDPISGDILFLDKNGNGVADATAVIVDLTEMGYTVIEGDVDNRVAGNNYPLDDPAVIGYGISAPEENLLVLAPGSVLAETDIPEGDIPETDVPETDAPETDVPETDVPETDTPETDTPETDTPETDVPESDNPVTDEEETDVQESETSDGGRVPMFSTGPVSGATATAPADDGVAATAIQYIGKTVSYKDNMFNNTSGYVVYSTNGGKHYAFDGNGNAVEISIDSSGNITADVSDPNILLWSFEKQSGNNTYLIRNNSTGMYMHSYANNGGGVVTSGAYSSVFVKSGSGARIRSNNEYARLNVNQRKYTVTSTQNQGAVFSFGEISQCTVWLDGTNGGLMSLGGSQNRSYTVQGGGTIQLPSQWQSPSKYNYTLRGWYDVKNGRYYPPGATVTVSENLVFYADWVATTYDVGQFNAYVANTVSTNDFITTRMFDYNHLFNIMSQSVAVSANGASHSETWNLLNSGYVPYKNMETLNYIFIDYDGGGDISYPNNRNDRNTSNSVYPGLYESDLAHLLFGTDNIFNPGTGEGVIGRTYVGTGDHLFQIMDDPNDPNYGYYYYDSALNAASYNQSEKRFYVYDYLERTVDSARVEDAIGKSDFLPLNSPYANTNGKTVVNYTYEGAKGEYQGVTHYQYDSRYNDNGSSANNVLTNFAFGMSIDIDFYLPNKPGDRTGGETGNRDVHGNEMHFKFTGDDDVWVLIDGRLALDIGGIHGIESGDINFSTGVVTVNGQQTGTLDWLSEGEHKLTIYYLERGSSQSNCAIYFNLAPRFSFSIRKEDVLTQHVLNGAQFSVYTDKECTQPARLWSSKASYDSGTPSTNVFTVINGVADMWGMSAGNTYYIRESKPPDNPDYGMPNGIITVSLDKRGVASYAVEIIDDTDGSDPSLGFTVHGFRIDEETQQAYIVATNAPKWVKEITSVAVMKQWADGADHSGDKVTVYLTMTEPDGTVSRIREVELSDANNWYYEWDNLPKQREDGSEIVYGIIEGYAPGYFSKVERVDGYDTKETEWTATNDLKNGQTYIIGSSQGYLSTLNNNADTGYTWVNETTAQSSPRALWTISTSGQNIKLTNGVGQTITFYYNNGQNGHPTDFFASTAGENNESKQWMRYTKQGSGIRLYYDGADGRDYYLISSMTSSNKFNYSTTANQALTLNPMVKTEVSLPNAGADINHLITNTPLASNNETSLRVYKEWDLGMTTNIDYQQAQVTVKLLANGMDTGRTITLSLKNNWQDAFVGLPYKDDNGNVITYSIVESWETEDWLPIYGEVRRIESSPPTYEVDLTNSYRWGRGYLLPETGGSGGSELIWILSGSAIMLTGLIYGYLMWRRQKGGRQR